jgi:maleylpyruvate isomerase
LIAHSHATTLRWMQEGTGLLLEAASSLDLAAYEESSNLPTWNRKALLAHLAANGDALRNLVHWAATGEETPMYESPRARTAGIEAGAKLPADDLLRWLGSSTAGLTNDLAALTPSEWQAQVRTAQGRTIAATQIPWLRAREVFVHVVDLRTGISFHDLPADFLEALKADIAEKRLRAGERLPDVHGSLAEVTAYLAGRPYGCVSLRDGTRAAELGPWL